MNLLDTLLYISNWLFWAPLSALIVSILAIAIDLFGGKFLLADLAVLPVGFLAIVYFLASCSYVGIAASYSCQRVSYVRHTAIALVFAAVVIYSIGQAWLGVAVATAIVLAVCLIAWTSRHARYVAEAARQASLARLARVTMLVAEASIVMFGSAILWILAYSIAYPAVGSAPATDNVLAIASLLPLACSGVLHVVLMFRLKQFLSRAKPVAAYLLAKADSNR